MAVQRFPDALKVRAQHQASDIAQARHDTVCLFGEMQKLRLPPLVPNPCGETKP